MNKQAISLQIELLIVGLIVTFFVIVALTLSGRLPGLFKSAAESQFDNVCCCKTINQEQKCDITVRQLCQQKDSSIDENKCPSLNK